MDYIKSRLAKLWTDFEDRSESVVDILTKQMEVDVDTKSQEVEKKAILKYEEEMIKVVSVYLRTYRDKFPDNEALNKYAVDIVQNKIMPQETNQFSKTMEKTKKSWTDFHVTEASK